MDFDQLYLYPDLVEERVRKSRESRQRNLKRHLRGRVAKYDVYEDPKEAKEMAEDYAGKRGANLQEHLDTLADVRRQLLLGDPNTRVDFTWGPDKICFACQSTESGQPGKHCLIPAGIDSNEGDSYRALEFLSGLQIAEGNIEGITEEDGKHSFSTNLGFLRSDVAMQTIEQKMKEFLFARNRRQNTRS